MVTIFCFGCTADTGSTQLRTGAPSMCTVQEPHCATPQPYLVPVRPSCSRSTHSSGVSGSASCAKSGTREFMARLEGDQKKDANLIGQFGVGFYSGFIVADRITVESRRAGLKAEEGVRWSSEGTGDFEVEAIARPERGTDVILHLRDGEEDFLRSGSCARSSASTPTTSPCPS
jgi:hypothetical protein